MAGEEVLKLGFSPCPNDTFIFGALALRKIPLRREYALHIEDVEALNQRAAQAELHVTKLSFAAFAPLTHVYQLLPVGAALGFGCGPLLVSRAPKVDVSRSRVALPGERTTAAFLFRVFFPEAQELVYMRYDEIIPALKAGEVEAGVLIHEGRFVYSRAGLHLQADLGRLWEETYQAPIPLGGLFVLRELPRETKRDVCLDIRESLSFARENWGQVFPFLKAHAQELEEEVIRRHVETFVNRYTYALGEEGRRAIDIFLELAAKRGLIKGFQKDYLWEACP